MGAVTCGRHATTGSPLQRLTLTLVLFTLVGSGCDTGVDIPEVVREPEAAGEVIRRVDLAEGPIELTLRGDAQLVWGASC